MSLEVRELSKRSYLRIIRKMVESNIKLWTFYPANWVINIVWIFVSTATAFLFAQMMIATGHPFGEDYFAFSMLASFGGAWLGVTLNSGHSAIRQAYRHKRLEMFLLSPMPMSLFIFASSIWSYILSTINMIISLALALLLGFTTIFSEGILLAFIAVILSNIATFGYGLMAASNIFLLESKAEGTGPSLTTVILGWIIRFASGNLYPLQFMPLWIQYLSILLPHTFVYDAVRRVFLPEETLGPLLIHSFFPFHPVATDLLILAIQCCILIPIGRHLFKISLQKAQREGDLTRWV